MARALARIYAGKGAEAVLAISSAARGTADAFSDMDLLVLWHEAPAEEARASVVGLAGGTLIRLYPWDEQWRRWGDLYTLGDTEQRPHSGVMCDVSHMLTTDFRSFIRAVADQHSTDEEHQDAAAMLAYGVGLEGRVLVEELRSSLHFDRELAVALATKWSVIDHFWRWRGALARGNNVVLANVTLARALESMLRVLFALNRRFFIGLGHVDEAVAALEIAPRDLGERLAAGFAAPLPQRAETIRALVEETLDLVERELQEIDVERLRRFFRFERAQHERMPDALASLVERGKAN